MKTIFRFMGLCLAAAALAVSFAACGGGKPGVYAVGYYVTADSNFSFHRACYWVDGERFDLPLPANADPAKSSSATGIAVSNGNRYISGWYWGDDDEHYACLWVNERRPQTLGKGDAFAVAAEGRTAYVAGRSNAEENAGPGYWAGGKFVSFPVPSEVIPRFTDAVSIAVKNSLVTATGNFSYTASMPVPRGCFWNTDGKFQDLSHPDTLGVVEARGITFHKGSIYAAGSYDSGSRDQACFWQDGMRTDLTQNGGYVRAIVSANDRLYIAGGYSNPDLSSVACYWDENGDKTEFAMPEGLTFFVNAIALDKERLYAVGYNEDGNGTSTPCYWVDGEVHSLSTDGKQAFATGIAVLR